MSWIPAAIGLAAGLLNRPPRPPRNRFLEQLQQIIEASTRDAQNLDWDQMVDRYQVEAGDVFRRNADLALRNLDARRAGTGASPNAYSTERSIAEGVALRDVLRDASLNAAQMRLQGPALRSSLLSAAGQLAASASGAQSQVNAMNFQNSMNQWSSVNQGIGALIGQMQGAGKANPGRLSQAINYRKKDWR